MFKKDKDLSERSRNLLKNKEVRTLKTTLLQKHPRLAEEQLSSLINNKTDVTSIKLASRTILYSIDNIVYFFDWEGRNILFPTLHCLWLFPDMLPTLTTYGPVSKFILNGADFMIPGIAKKEGLEEVREGEPCCIKIIGNPLPFAVGVSLFDGKSLLVEGSSRKGKAATIHHSYGDLLTLKCKPNEGFTLQVIRPTEKVDVESDEETADETEIDNKQDPEIQREDGDSSEEADLTEPLTGAADRTAVERTPEDDECTEDLSSDMKNTTIADHLESSSASMDEVSWNALGLALRYIVKDKQLPMLASTFWSWVQRLANSIESMIF